MWSVLCIASVWQGGVFNAFRMEIITPTDYVGPLMELAQARRGDFKDMTYLTETRTTLVYDMPLAEVGLILSDGETMPWYRAQ